VVRLAPGATSEAAQAEAQVLVDQAVQADPPRDPYDPPRLVLEELGLRFSELQQSVGRPLRLLAAAVSLLLLITCANVGGLLFARGTARHRELATRLALGGSRRRIIQQLMIESALICVAGAAAAIALAYALRPLMPLLLAELAGVAAVGVNVASDSGVLAFMGMVAVTCGLLCGVWPAIAVSRIDPAAVLKHASSLAPPARTRAGTAALCVQVALSLLVTLGAVLLVRTMFNLRDVPLGWKPEGLAFAETNNPVGRPRAVVDDTVAALAALPGVTSAVASDWPLFNNATPRFRMCVPGDRPSEQDLDLSLVQPGFFTTWGVRLVLGRDLDDGSEPIAVVNEAFVRRFLPGRDPLTATVGAGGCPGRSQLRIVGVVADHIDRQRVDLVPAVYARYPRAGALYVTTYAVRVTGEARAIVPAIRRIIAERNIAPTRDVRTGTQYRDGVMRQERLLTVLFVLFGVLALFTCTLGLYGMLACLVQWRTAEIGLRRAVGASDANVTALIAGESLRPVTLGLLAGAVAAQPLGRAAGAVLFGVSPSDPLSLVTAVGALASAAAIAAWIPTRRAIRVDPVPALRAE
jgi:predicted permease